MLIATYIFLSVISGFRPYVDENLALLGLLRSK